MLTNTHARMLLAVTDSRAEQEWRIVLGYLLQDDNDEEVGALEKERERAPRDVAGMLRALEFDEHRHQLLCEVMFLC
jgi:hypothetical protein